jgi:hypothetical protein
MILAPLFGLSLVVATATSPMVDDFANAPTMTTQQKSAALQPLVRSTTECIARTVGSDPRLSTAETGPGFGDLIVDSVASCANQVREMIDAHDAYFGEGTGEKFFMGPYLDVLPGAVSRWLKTSAQH